MNTKRWSRTKLDKDGNLARVPNSLSDSERKDIQRAYELVWK